MRRDEPDVYQVRGPPPLPAPAATVIAALSPVVTPARRARIDAVVARRSRRLIPVLEGVTDPHNGSAVLRSADAFGLQEVHVVDGPHGFLAAHAVSRGTHRWLDVVRHERAVDCVGALRSRGYEVWVAAMDGEHGPRDVGRHDRLAVVFGNEHRGASEAMRDGAHGTYAIGMRGFVESLNVSVAAAITMHAATAGRASELSPDERDELTARFLMATVRDAARIVAEHAA